MWKLFGSKKKKKLSDKISDDPTNKPLRKHIPYICMLAVGTILIAGGAWALISEQREDVQAREEYKELREIAVNIIASELPDLVNGSDEEPEETIDEEGYAHDDEEARLLRALSLSELSRINNDFIGWISIRGLIEYPIIRGNDNDRYLNTTFAGRTNTSGAIFMDYRHSEDFGEKITLIYGHNTRDGSMFAPLVRYLDADFLKRNPTIRITTLDGNILIYRIFAAKLTDTWDSVYTIGISNPERAAQGFPNAPENASRFLILSTCTRGGSRDERILVFAALFD